MISRSAVGGVLGLILVATMGCAAGGAHNSDGGTGTGGDDCVDNDGDGAGFGEDCTADDCDDTDPQTISECGQNCDAHPTRRGCPCNNSAPVACYHGPEGTVDVGRCVSGLQVCEHSLLGECVGQQLPVDEICDEADNDCDGHVDNGVLNECGSCVPCQDSCSGPVDGCEEFDVEGETVRLIETPEGYLQLGGTASHLHVIWPSSSATGQVLRVNTRTFEVEGAYYTGTNHTGIAIFSGDSPSRTAVDDDGNVIIANRSFGDWASVTKVAAGIDTCIDRNQNGSIETSQGWNDVLPFRAHDDWDDECVLWHTLVGNEEDAVARAVAIHTTVGLDGVAVERGWVGLYNEQRFVELDTVTGELTGREAPTPNFMPYGAALDRDGFLWATGMSRNVGRIDTANPADSFAVYSLREGQGALRVIVDENNNPWLSGNDAYRFDRETEQFEAAGLVVPAESTSGMVGGIASDGDGSIWVGSYTDGEFVYRISNDDSLDWHAIETPGTATFGMAADFDGQVWTFGYTDGTATVIDIETERTQHVLADCNGSACLSAAYVRGDITGLQRRNALDPAGRWTHVVDGCQSDPTDWQRVSIDAETPPGSSIDVAVRTSDDLAELHGLAWIPVGTIPEDGESFDIGSALARAGQEPGLYLEVQITLQSDDHVTTPILRSVHVQWDCAEGVE